MNVSTPAPRDWGFATLLLLAWPVIVSRSAQAVVGFCDALMTAPLGEAALTAVTAGSLNVLTAVILPMGIAFIVQSYAAQHWGKGDQIAARRYGWYGIILSVAAGLLFALTIPLAPWAVSWLHYEPSIKALMGEYVGIRLLSIGAAVGIEALGNWYGGIGNTRVQMRVSLAMMLINVALNWLLIEGHLGAPALGVAGAAWASVISAWVGFVLITVLFVRGKAMGVSGPLKGTQAPMAMREFLRMLRFGIPAGANWFLEFAAFMFFINVVVADLGTVTAAAVLAVVQVNSVSFMPAFGIASAGSILCGQAIGSGMKDEVPAILRRTMTTAAIWQGSVAMVYVLAPVSIMALFAPRDDLAAVPAIAAVGATLLMISAAWQLFDSISMTIAEALRAAGDTDFSMWARLAIAWLLFVPGSYLSVNVWNGGAAVAMLSIVAYMALLALIMTWRFRMGAWRGIDLVEEPALDGAIDGADGRVSAP